MSAIAVSRRAGVTLTLAAGLSIAAFVWPLFLRPSSLLSGALPQAPWVFALVLPLVLAIVLAELSGDGLDVKALAMLGVLTAVGALVRPLSAGTAGFELVFFLIILGGRVFGAGFGFVLGATTLFTSALLTGGVGPWLPYQMLGAGFVGLGAGMLPRRLRGVREIVLLAIYGFACGFGYGALLDFAFWPFAVGNQTSLSFDPSASIAHNLHTFLLYNLATAMGWNLGRALSNVVLIAILGPGVLLVLRRAARRAAFETPARQALS